MTKNLPVHNEDKLVEWFKEKFRERTPPKTVLDATPEYRVGWTEILAQMRAVGYADSVLDLRYLWDEIFRRRRLRLFCNRVLRAAGERALPRRTTVD